MLHSYTSSLRLIPLLCLVLCSSLASQPAAAQDVWGTVPSLEVVRSRLSLTPEQEVKLRPIFEQRIGEVQSLRDQLAKASTQQQKDSLLRASKQGAEAFNSQVEAVLDASQKSDWQEMREQTREKLKERNQESQ